MACAADLGQPHIAARPGKGAPLLVRKFLPPRNG